MNVYKRHFSNEEINSAKYAVVIDSKYGHYVMIEQKDSHEKILYPVDEHSNASFGLLVDLEKSALITYRKATNEEKTYIVPAFYDDCRYKTYVWDFIHNWLLDHDFIQESKSNDGTTFSRNCEYIIQFGLDAAKEYSYAIPSYCKVIADGCFTPSWDDCTTIEFREVHIPNTIEAIGNYAFLGCKYVDIIRIPKSVRQIEGNPFPANMKIISDSPYFIVQNEILFNVAKTTLIHCFSNAKQITIPETVQKISERALRCNPNVRTLFVSENVKEIGEYAFADCESLYTILYNVKLEKIPDGLFYNTSIYRFDIPEFVKEIGSSAFSDCTHLQEIYIPNGVLKIGSHAFKGDAALKKITIPLGVSSIEQSLFEDCSSLEEVVIPEGIKTISYSAFKNCKKLRRIVIPDSVEEIRDSAFEGCSSLEEIEIHKKTHTIGIRAFGNCSSLSKVMWSKSSIDKIEVETFCGCKKLQHIEIPDGIKTIGGAAFEYSGLTHIYIPDSISSIGGSAFSGCENLLSVRLSCNVKKIPEFCFHGCISLSRVTLCKGIKEIEQFAFDNCPKLKCLILPEGLETLNCNFESTRMKHLYVPSTISDLVPYNSWHDSDGYENLHVPIGMKEIAENALKETMEILNGDFEEPQEISEYVIIDNIVYEIADEDNRLLNVKFIIDDFKHREFIIPSSVNFKGRYYNVTSIGVNAFYNSSIEHIRISEGIKSIGAHAFSYCQYLTEVELPNSLTDIEGELFYKCIRLKNIFVGFENESFLSVNGVLYSKNLKTIKAFPNAKGETYEIIKGTEFIDNFAFKSCVSLKSLRLPQTIKSIGDNAFYGCDNLQSIIIPGNFEKISILQERTKTLFNYKGESYSVIQFVHLMNKKDI